MDDLISREAAIKRISDMIHEYREKGEYRLAEGMYLALQSVGKQLPAVDAAPVVHAEWIEEPDREGHYHLGIKTFDQADPRWGKNMFSICGNTHQTIATSGSGPTIAADVVATLKDDCITPLELSLQAVKWGCRTHSCGTSWSFFAKVAEYYKFSGFVQSCRFECIPECLDAGGLVVCSMSNGYWTNAGCNYILCVLCDGSYMYGFTAHKPKLKSQPINNFRVELRQCFCFYP